MMENLLEHLNIKIIRPEGDGQFLCECPWCGKQKLYIDMKTGQYFCQSGSCQKKGNPYTLVRELLSVDHNEIKRILGEYRIGDDMDYQAESKSELTKPHIRLKKEECCYMTSEEIDKFCQVKHINKDAFKKVMGNVIWRHTKHPWALLPSYNPSNLDHTWGIMRAHLEGKLIKTSHGEDKYPQIHGSKHGLFGVRRVLNEDPKEIIFTEGWRDAVATTQFGYYAIASSGGASCWKDEWLPAFKGKKVYVIFDADHAGMKAAHRAAKAIYNVVDCVKIIQLPYEIKEDHGKDLYDFIQESNQ